MLVGTVGTVMLVGTGTAGIANAPSYVPSYCARGFWCTGCHLTSFISQVGTPVTNSSDFEIIATLHRVTNGSEMHILTRFSL